MVKIEASQTYLLHVFNSIFGLDCARTKIHFEMCWSNWPNIRNVPVKLFNCSFNAKTKDQLCMFADLQTSNKRCGTKPCVQLIMLLAVHCCPSGCKNCLNEIVNSSISIY